MEIMAINPGYYATKGKVKDNYFLSRMSKNEFGSLQGGVDQLTLNDEKLIIGAGEISMDPDKTNNEFTRAMVINMLAKHTAPNEVKDFKIGVTVPPKFFGALKEPLANYLRGCYPVHHNGAAKTIIINDVKIIPETISGYLANDPAKWLGRKLIVGDIGGYTTNLVLIDERGMFTSDDVITMKQHGMYFLDHSIAEYINTVDLLGNYNDDDVQYLRDIDDDLLLDSKVTDIVDSFVDKMLQEMSKKKWNYSRYDFLWLGGGSMTLIDDIQRFLPQSALSNDPLYDNYKGADMITRRAFNG